MRHIGLQVRQKSLSCLRGWFGQQQQRTAQQQDCEVQREMDVRMVAIGVR